MIDSFIPTELAVAPNPLGIASNLRLTTIPIDAYTCFELWMPPTDTVLLTEETMLLRGDRARLEEICAKLTWLLGAKIVGHEEYLRPTLVDSWQGIQLAMQQIDARFDAIVVNYLPQAICPNLNKEGLSLGWTLRPASWTVSFLAFTPVNNGFRAVMLPIAASIALGSYVSRPVQRLNAIAALT